MLTGDWRLREITDPGNGKTISCSEHFICALHVPQGSIERRVLMPPSFSGQVAIISMQPTTYAHSGSTGIPPIAANNATGTVDVDSFVTFGLAGEHIAKLDTYDDTLILMGITAGGKSVWRILNGIGIVYSK